MQNHPATGPNPSAASIFGEDGKLSSASAAASLKYAKPQDLPSYPSSGGQMSAAGAAASLASHNRKSFEHWKPEPIPAANQAAFMAKDHKMDPLWKPEASAAGSKAAMMAAAHPTHVEPMQKRAPTVKTSAPSAAYDTAENTHQKALMAANAASHNRRRSDSLPTQPVNKPTKNSSWAMQAANKSHKDGPPSITAPFTTGDPGFEAARIQNIAKNNVDRQMYTSAPPVAIEVQEKNRQDTLRASAVAMAQKMYAIQQKHIDEAAAASKSDGQALAASRAHPIGVVPTSSTTTDHTPIGAGYEGLEEAARRLAQERLAKLNDEHAEYRSYYGQSSSPVRSRLSMRLGRRRASSVADDDSSDEEQSRRIKTQMSIFQSKVADVDNKKRQQDRDNLLQIAHRNVDAQISKMDSKVFESTGKASPAQTEKWEKAAREKAQKDSDERMQYAGKVHIGGGKYLEQSELDAIARARLQPTLDDISDKAEKQRARDEEVRIERVRRAEQANREKARENETAALVKAEAEKVKREERAQREAEKAQKADEKQKEKERRKAEQEEKRRPKEVKSSQESTPLDRSGTTTTGPEAGAGSGSALEAKSTTSDVVSVTDTDREGETFHDLVTSPTTGSNQPEVSPLKPSDLATSSIPTSGSTEPAVITSEPSDTATFSIPTASTANERKSLDGKKSMDYRSSMDEDNETASSPAKSRVKSWMKVRFRSKSNAQKNSESMPVVTEGEITEKGKSVEHDGSVPQAGSMRDVTMAGRNDTSETQDMYGSAKDVSPERTTTDDHVTRSRSTSISSLSSDVSPERTVPTDAALATTRASEIAVPTDTALGTTEQSETKVPTGTASRATEKTEPEADHKAKLDKEVPTNAILSSTEQSEEKVSTDTAPTTTIKSEPETEQRGRSGFKQRLLNKIKPNREKPKEELKAKPKEEMKEEPKQELKVEPKEQPKEQPKDEPKDKQLTRAATNTTDDDDDDDDEFEEARDQFEEEKLAPPPALPVVAEEGSKATPRSPKGSRERSKFTEEL